MSLSGIDLNVRIHANPSRRPFLVHDRFMVTHYVDRASCLGPSNVMQLRLVSSERTRI